MYFGMKLYMFRTVPLSIIRSFSLYTHQWYMSYRFVDSFRAGSRLKAVYKRIWNIPLLCVQWKTPDDGQRNCPKLRVSFQNKFEKLVHLVVFIIRICHDARSRERKIGVRGLHQMLFCHHSSGTRTSYTYMKAEVIRLNVTPVLRASSYSGIP